jgi:hypothetical protein
MRDHNELRIRRCSRAIGTLERVGDRVDEYSWLLRSTARFKIHKHIPRSRDASR